MSAELLDAYRAGELDAAAATRLAAALADPQAGPALRAQLRFEAQLVAVLAEGDADGHERALSERLRADGDDARFERVLRTRLPRRRGRRRRARSLVPALALAALMAIAIPAALWLRPSDRVVTDPAAPEAVAELVAGTGVTSAGRALAPGSAVASGSQLAVARDGSATLRCADGSELRLDPGSILALRSTDGIRAMLDRGRVHAAVSAQGAGRRFELRTPEAAVTVLGTTFSVAADADGSRVAVGGGRVAVQAIGGERRELGPGDSCRVDAAGSIAVRAAPRRVVLFDGDGAEAWRPLRGRWTVVEGLLTGSGDADGAARIATRATFDDVAIELRVRARDCVQLELQLRGYRAFWAVPGEQLDDWVTLRASADGDDLRATIDGRSLALERPDSEVDPPYISVYARFDRLDGRVEIAAASATTTDPVASTGGDLE